MKGLNLKQITVKDAPANSNYDKIEKGINENGVNFTIYIKEMENIIFKHIMIEKNGKMLTRRNKEYKDTFTQLEKTYKAVNHYYLKQFKGIEVMEFKN